MVWGNSGVAHPSLLEHNALSDRNELSSDTFAIGSITKTTAVVNTYSAPTISHCVSSSRVCLREAPILKKTVT